MHSLEVIKTACVDALEKSEDGAEWRAEYCSIVDPSTALEMAARIEQCENLISGEELQALGKLVRELTGYIRLTAGDKADPMRDDLLLHARQLLGVMGI